MINYYQGRARPQLSKEHIVKKIDDRINDIAIKYMLMLTEDKPLSFFKEYVALMTYEFGSSIIPYLYSSWSQVQSEMRYEYNPSMEFVSKAQADIVIMKTA